MKIGIASGKGGTGKTFLSTNLFKTMEIAGLSSVLVDCDAEVPNDSIFIHGVPLQSWETQQFCPEIDTDKCTYCNACQEYCTFHAITCVPAMQYIHLSADICHGCEACVHACSSGAIRSGYKAVGTVTAYGENEHPKLFEARLHEGQRSSVPVIREAIKRAVQTNARYIILDAPPGCSCPFVNTVFDADLILLVTEPTPFGLNDLKQTIEVLRDLNKNFCVLINRSDLGDGQLKAYLNNERIPIIGEIPFSRSLAKNYAEGKLAVEEDKELKELFNQLMQRILNYENSHH